MYYCQGKVEQIDDYRKLKGQIPPSWSFFIENFECISYLTIFMVDKLKFLFLYKAYYYEFFCDINCLATCLANKIIKHKAIFLKTRLQHLFAFLINRNVKKTKILACGLSHVNTQVLSEIDKTRMVPSNLIFHNLIFVGNGV